MKKQIIAPSILAADFSKLGEEVRRVYNAGCRRLHIDVMDGVFVPNISIGACVMKSIRKQFPDMIFDVHLMIIDPIKYVDDFANAGADVITVHIESQSGGADCIRAIKARGLKAGVSIKPATPIEAVNGILGDADEILVMSVNPGFGGQSFIPESPQKIESLRKMLDRSGFSNTVIAVDGGINGDTGKACFKAGADVLVAGTWIFRNDDIAKCIAELED